MTNRILLTGAILTPFIIGFIAHYLDSRPIQVVTAKSDEYVINKEMVLSKLQTESQIVSMTQHIEKQDTYVDDSILGERQTTLTVKGTVKLGLNTSEIKVKCIDSGVVTLHIGKPQIISLELPYDEITFDKTKGWLRQEMDEKERKEFYNIVEKNVRKKLLNDDLMAQADMFNQNAVEDLLKVLPGVKGVLFE